MQKKGLKVVNKNDIDTANVTEKKVRFSLKRGQLCIPYGLFLALFVVFPLLLIVYYAFTNGGTGGISVSDFGKFFTNRTAITNLLYSIFIALITTVICLVVAYPVAYILARTSLNRNGVMLLLLIMPMWINFVLRAMAMKELLDLIGLYGKNELVCTIIGMVYDFLPFMILPLYSTLTKIDKSMGEASQDLGGNAFITFTRVTFPLSMPGVVSGITMVFMPTMTCYVISDTFGRGKVTIIGKLIEEQFGSARNWGYGSAIALILLVIMLVSMALTGGFKSENTRGTAL